TTRGLRLLLHPHQPRRLDTAGRCRGRALVPPPHYHREHLPRQQTRRRATPPTLRLPRGQHRLDVGRPPSRHHGRLAPPNHRHPPPPPGTRRQGGQAHHPPPPPTPHRHPRPPHPPQPHHHPTTTTRPPPLSLASVMGPASCHE